MAVGYDGSLQGPHRIGMMPPRHPSASASAHSAWTSHQQPKHTTVAYVLPPPQPQQQHWYPYDGRPIYAPYPVEPAYHTPPMPQAAFNPYAGPQYGFWPQPPPEHIAAVACNPVVSACRDSAEPKSIAEGFMDDPSSDCFKGLKLIPASASVIPPHPSLEESAVPLSAVGADLVWELVHQALTQGASRSGSVSPRSGAYGTIGGERSQAKQQQQQAALAPLVASLAQYSLASSQQQPRTLVGPLTPPSSTMSSACPIPPQFQSHKFAAHELPPWSDKYWESTRSPESSPTASGRRDARPDAYRSFASFCDNLLNVTLVTPQTLLLALHYVCQACREASPAIYRTFSARSAPYKIFIGALVMANKVLDDNSYKSQTWAQVSAIPLKDVNASEAFVFDALAFDVSMSTREWSDFIYQLAMRYGRSSFLDDGLLRRLSVLADIGP